MNRKDIEHMWKVASNNPSHDTNWFDPVVIRFAALVAEREYERGVIDGRQIQMQSSVDKAVNAMTQPTYYIPNKDERTWVGLTPQERDEINEQVYGAVPHHVAFHHAIEAKLKEKNT